MLPSIIEITLPILVQIIYQMGDELKLHACLGMERRKETYKLCVICQSRRAAVVEHTWYCSDSVGVRTRVEYVTQ